MGIIAWQLNRTEAAWSDLVEHGTEAASQTFIVGNPLIPSSSNLQIATVTWTAGINTGLVGIALNKATGVTAADVMYVPALPHFIFLGSVDGAASGGNAPITGKPTDLTKYVSYGVTVDTLSGNWYIDSSKTSTNLKVQVLGWDPDQASVIQGKVMFRFLAAQTIWGL